MKKVAILQSNYIPWKGYFDLINMVDEFILYDDMQYTKNDWRNRNKIKTSNGAKWLTLPILTKGKCFQKISEAKVKDIYWKKNHWLQIKSSYSKAPAFADYSECIEELYLDCNEVYLSKINYLFIKRICEILNINTVIRWSSEFILEGDRTERVLGICKDCNANIYLSGPSAKEYFDVEKAKQENIQVEWMNYDGYKQYNQLYPPFEHGVTILDLIFNEGNSAARYMKSFEDDPLY